MRCQSSVISRQSQGWNQLSRFRPFRLSRRNSLPCFPASVIGKVVAATKTTRKTKPRRLQSEREPGVSRARFRFNQSPIPPREVEQKRNAPSGPLRQGLLCSSLFAPAYLPSQTTTSVSDVSSLFFTSGVLPISPARRWDILRAADSASGA